MVLYGTAQSSPVQSSTLLDSAIDKEAVKAYAHSQSIAKLLYVEYITQYIPKVNSRKENSVYQ